MFGAHSASLGGSTRDAFERAEQVLTRVGMQAKARLSAQHLTVPDLKRLELAKALAMEPRVLLLDEVMAGLHGGEIGEAIDLIRQIHASGVTLLVVEHVMQAIMTLSERLIVLEFGKKIAEGTPTEIVENREVIKAYLGSRYAQRTDDERPTTNASRARPSSQVLRQ
jgi:branched-chain amino acid transport system ATP-binding protein